LLSLLPADPLPSGADPLPSEAPEPELDEVVVPLAGAELLPGAFFDSLARAGEIATSPTMPAASGNRNRRFIGRLLTLV
jgi:hypothetical protein